MALFDGLASSEAQQNLFLTCWLATALKQRLFHREVAQDTARSEERNIIS